MKFRISDLIIKKYPELEVGIVIAKDFDNSQTNQDIQELFSRIQNETKEKINPEKINDIPVIKRWREVYKSFGAKPRDYRSSIESLVRRVTKKEIPQVNNLVDIYNYISFKYLLTVGGEDLEKIKGDLILDFALGNEEFIPLGSDKNESPWKGEVVYKDDQGIICRCWNWREGDRTKITKETKKAIIVIENLIPEESEKLDNALKETKMLLEKYNQANCEIAVVNINNPSEEINY